MTYGHTPNLVYVAPGKGMSRSRSQGSSTKITEAIRVLEKLSANFAYLCAGDFEKESYESVPSATACYDYYKYLVLHYLAKQSFMSVPKQIWAYNHDKFIKRETELLIKSLDWHPNILWERNASMHETSCYLARKYDLFYVNEWVDRQHKTFGRPRYWQSKIELRKLKMAHVIVVPARACLKLIDPGVDRNKIIVSGLGANTQLIFRDMDSRKEIRNQFNIPENRPLAVYCGSFAPYHRMDVFFKYLARWCSENKLLFDLLIMGDYSKSHNIVNVLNQLKQKTKIICTGKVPYKSIGKYLSAADIGFLPHCEPYIYPVKLVEFGAAGLSIVAPNTPANKELITNNVSGLLFDFGNIPDLISKMNLLCVNLDYRLKLARKFNKIAQDYSWDRIWSNTFQKMLEHYYVWRKKRG